MAVIDAPARFQTAVRGYDRSAVDAVIRTEQAQLERLNERISVLERHLAAARGAEFRIDDPTRKQSIQAAADLLSDAWDYARQVVNAEDATAELQRNHAASIAAGYLAEVTTWAQEQEQRAQAEADAMIAAAHAEADELVARATDFVENAVPMAEALTVEANEEAQALALSAETDLHTRREAVEADLTQRQTVVDYDLQAAERLAAQLRAESSAVTEQATRMHETALAQAQAIHDDLINSVADEIGRLEEESDLAMAELAEHMATLSTQVTSARKTMAARPAGAPRAKPETAAPQAEPVAPKTAAAPATADAETTAPMPKAKAPRKVAEAAQPAPRTRKTTPAPASGLKSGPAKPAPEAVAVAVATETEEVVVPAARQLAVPQAYGAVTISASGVPILRL